MIAKPGVERYDVGLTRYREIQPPARLRRFVSAIWVLEHDGESAEIQRVVPDGRCELILNWGQPFEAFQSERWLKQPGCFFAGQLEGPLLLRPNGRARMVGIRFHPIGAAAIFPRPMQELTGRFAPVDDLAPQLSRSLNRALDSPDPVAAVDRALWSARQLSPGSDLVMEDAVRRIGMAKGGCDLAVLSRELGLSLRQFERRFLSAVGLPPKLFCRIERFNNVFRVLGQSPTHWVNAAIDCGYYDQSHLIRDCKRLCGETPAILMAEAGDLARHFYRRFSVSHSSNTAGRR